MMMMMMALMMALVLMLMLMMWSWSDHQIIDFHWADAVCGICCGIQGIKQRCTHPRADLTPGLAAVAAHQHRRASEQSSQGTCTSQPIHLGLERWRSCGKRELHISQSLKVIYGPHTQILYIIYIIYNKAILYSWIMLDYVGLGLCQAILLHESDWILTY